MRLIQHKGDSPGDTAEATVATSTCQSEINFGSLGETLKLFKWSSKESSIALIKAYGLWYHSIAIAAKLMAG